MNSGSTTTCSRLVVDVSPWPCVKHIVNQQRLMSNKLFDKAAHEIAATELPPSVATAKNKHRPAFVTRICRCGCWLLDEERVRGGPRSNGLKRSQMPPRRRKGAP